MRQQLVPNSIPADLPCNLCGHDYSDHVWEFPESGPTVDCCAGCVADGYNNSQHSYENPLQLCQCGHQLQQHHGRAGACTTIISSGYGFDILSAVQWCQCPAFA